MVWQLWLVDRHRVLWLHKMRHWFVLLVRQIIKRIRIACVWLLELLGREVRHLLLLWRLCEQISLKKIPHVRLRLNKLHRRRLMLLLDGGRLRALTFLSLLSPLLLWLRLRLRLRLWLLLQHLKRLHLKHRRLLAHLSALPPLRFLLLVCRRLLWLGSFRTEGHYGDVLSQW